MNKEIELEEVRALAQKYLEERDDFQAKYQWMVDRACDQRLDGYRELGSKCAQLENENEDLKLALCKIKLHLTIKDIDFSLIKDCNDVFKAHAALKREINKKVNYFREMISENAKTKLEELEVLCLKLGNDHNWKHNAYNITHEYEYQTCTYCGASRTLELL